MYTENTYARYAVEFLGTICNVLLSQEQHAAALEVLISLPPSPSIEDFIRGADSDDTKRSLLAPLLTGLNGLANKRYEQWMGNAPDEVQAYRVIGISPDWFERAITSMSTIPQGDFKQAWTMKLLRSGHRCQLPRGFMSKHNKQFFVGRDTRPRQNRDIGKQIGSDLKAFAARCFTKGKK